MKKRISITLSKELLAKVDGLAGSKRARAIFIERALRQYFCEHRRTAVDGRDVERINGAAERLNKEAAEVLEYQSADPGARFGSAAE
jgi:metal-responsive CopG/Arc/MetJ family transcriptional regulator